MAGPGRPDFSQAGSQGSGQTVAVQNKVEVQHVTADQTASVAAGTNATTEIYAPTGSTYRPVEMYLDAPGPGGTTGTHYFSVQTIGALGVTFGESAYNGTITWTNAHWQAADSQSKPTTVSAQTLAIRRLMATENSPITVNYNNQTDASQSSTRTIEFAFEQESY